MSGSEGDRWLDDLRTLVQTLAYDFRTQTGRLTLPDLCCTNMDGCIRLFTAIDPHVRRIETIAGNVPDITYLRDRAGWVARHPGGTDHA